MRDISAIYYYFIIMIEPFPVAPSNERISPNDLRPHYNFVGTGHMIMGSGARCGVCLLRTLLSNKRPRGGVPRTHKIPPPPPLTLVGSQGYPRLAWYAWSRSEYSFACCACQGVMGLR